MKLKIEPNKIIQSCPKKYTTWNQKQDKQDNRCIQKVGFFIYIFYKNNFLLAKTFIYTCLPSI